MSLLTKSLASLLSIPALAACATNLEPIDTVAQVDLERFMGDWYVIASIPTAIEKNAYNAVENYALNSDGTVATTFTFRKGGFDGKEKIYRPKGFVRDTETNATWGMQFVWPFKAQYKIIYLNDDYSQTMIGRDKRDLVWIMARSPKMSDTDYLALTTMLVEQGYELTDLKKVPQQW